MRKISKSRRKIGKIPKYRKQKTEISENRRDFKSRILEENITNPEISAKKMQILAISAEKMVNPVIPLTYNTPPPNHTSAEAINPAFLRSIPTACWVGSLKLMS